MRSQSDVMYGANETDFPHTGSFQWYAIFNKLIAEDKELFWLEIIGDNRLEQQFLQIFEIHEEKRIHTVIACFRAEKYYLIRD